MPRRKKALPNSPATEPTTVAAALEHSPIAQIIASHEAKAQVEPERPMTEPDQAVAAFQRQRERDQAVTQPHSNGTSSHAAKILAERPAFRQVQEEYFRVSSHEREGIRVFKNTIMKGGQKIGVAGIQFAENRQPTREEKDSLLDRGFRYKIEDNLWKREGRPGEPLGDNTIDAIRVAADLAREREGLAR